MEIKIEICNDDGETIFTATTSSFEIAEMELGKGQRYCEKLQAQAESAWEAQQEEEALEANEKQNA